MNKNPLVSIGVPVRNEERFLAQALESLLNQQYPNMEIIISDNASTDATGEIARTFSVERNNVHYSRRDPGIGPAENFNHAVTRASGKYFMWASGHDLWSSNYIQACVQALEQNRNACIAYGLCHVIDETDRKSGIEFGCYDTRGMDSVSRFFTTFWGSMNPVYGLHRRENLLRNPLPNIVGGDLVLLSHLSLKGEFVLVEDAYWSRREFRKEASYTDKLQRYKSSDYGLATSWFDRVFPLARLPGGIIRAVVASDMRVIEKMTTIFALLSAMLVRYISGNRK